MKLYDATRLLYQKVEPEPQMNVLFEQVRKVLMSSVLDVIITTVALWDISFSRLDIREYGPSSTCLTQPRSY